MKKLINRGFMMLMLMAVMTLGFVSCSDDDGPDDGSKGGKMTGWVKIDGKKTDMNFCYGMSVVNSFGSELGFTAWSKNVYKVKPNEKVSFADFEIAFNPDGSLALENGRNAVSFEIYIDSRMTTDGTVGGKVYVLDNDYNAITATKDGDKYVIDGRGVKVEWGEVEGESISDPSGKTTIDFHFEGTPEWLSDEDFID